MKSVANPIWVIESDSCKNSEQNLFQKECFIWKLQFSMAVYNQQEPAFTPLHSSSPSKLHNKVPEALLQMFTKVTRKKTAKKKEKKEKKEGNADFVADVSMSSIGAFLYLYTWFPYPSL